MLGDFRLRKKEDKLSNGLHKENKKFRVPDAGVEQTFTGEVQTFNTHPGQDIFAQ
jgi:hypothetical protein